MTAAAVVGATSPARLTPYISVDMFRRDGRRGVSVDQLAPGGRPADQTAALEQYIESASSYVDSFCQQILAATVDTYVGRYNVGRDGYVIVHPRYRPVIALTAFAIGVTPSQLATLTTLTGSIVAPNYFSVPAYAGAMPINTNQGPIQFGNPAILPGRAYCQYSYQNGFPVTQLTAGVTAGATSISVADTTGIVSGLTWLTIYSGATRYRFLAGTVSTAPAGGVGTGPGTVACAAVPQAITINESTPVMVSALPADIIQAVVLVTRAFIKDAGSGNVTSPTISANDSESGDNGVGNDLNEAAGLLRPYVAPLS